MCENVAMSQELKSTRNESDYTESGSLTQGRKRMGESGDVRVKAGKFFMGEKEKVLGRNHEKQCGNQLLGQW